MEFERGTQLKGYIQREVKEKQIHSNYGYTYYFCRNFLERLFAEAPDTFVLKGSFSQFTNLGKPIRPLTDMDIVTPGNIGEANDAVLSLVNSDNLLKYEIKQKFVTTNATINYRFLCKFDKIERVISMDLRKQDDLLQMKKELPIYFSKDRSFDVNAITLEEHFANKLYIALLNLKLNEKLGKDFRRFKDFYDIHGILSNGNLDENLVRYFLTERIRTDQFLSGYKFDGNLFTKEFINTYSEEFEEDSKKYGFDPNVKFSDVIDVTNEAITKLKR